MLCVIGATFLGARSLSKKSSSAKKTAQNLVGIRSINQAIDFLRQGPSIPQFELFLQSKTNSLDSVTGHENANANAGPEGAHHKEEALSEADF
jgi:hypothetical protein